MKQRKLLTVLIAFSCVISAWSSVAVDGNLPGLFSVDANKFVHFTQGNLQYNPAQNQWRLAPNQTDWVGEDNLEMGNPAFNGWLDLFCWSLGANNNYGATSAYDTIQYINATFEDWGNLFPGQEWRTMTYNEWNYVLNSRANANQKWGMAMIDGTIGMVLLPDQWTAPSGVTFVPQTIPTSELWDDADAIDASGDHYRVKPENMPANVFMQSEWAILEAAGAVFLPYAGRRSGGYGNHINKDNQTIAAEYKYSYYENYLGTYWTATMENASKGTVKYMYTFKLVGSNDYQWGKAVFWGENGRYGQSVRLVREIIPVIGDGNSAAIDDFLTDNNGQTINLLEIDRPIVNNMYNTICLPFDMTAAQIANSSLADVEIREFDGATVSVADATLELHLSNPVNEIVAGRPYFVKYNNDSQLSEIYVRCITINNADVAAEAVTFNGVTFKGTFAPFTMPAQTEIDFNGGYLCLGRDNTLFWPNVTNNIRPFRAYFIVNVANTSGAPVYHGMPARLIEPAMSPTAVENAAQTVQSRKCIKNGQLIIIRNGVRYNAAGQVIQ